MSKHECTKLRNNSNGHIERTPLEIKQTFRKSFIQLWSGFLRRSDVFENIAAWPIINPPHVLKTSSNFIKTFHKLVDMSATASELNLKT